MPEINETNDVVITDAPDEVNESEIKEQKELDTQLDNKYNEYLEGDKAGNFSYKNKLSDTSEVNEYKVIKEVPAEEVNESLKKDGCDKPPYRPETSVKEIELTETKTYSRVYDGENSGIYGGWCVESKDIEGLSAKQIQDKYALPTEPKYVCDVTFDRGTHLRTGEANEIDGWGKGGGQQFDTMGNRCGFFSNERKLNER